MKYLFTAFMLSAILLVNFSSFAKAADEKEAVVSLKIAVVDVQQLMNVSAAAKSIQSQSKDIRAKYQSRIAEVEKKLKESEKKVIDAGKAKDQEKFMESRKEFQKDLVEGQKELQELNRKLDKAVANALNDLRDEIVDIVDDLTSEREYDLVITRADVVTVSKNIDITNEVMKLLNDKVSSIKVKE